MYKDYSIAAVLIYYEPSPSDLSAEQFHRLRKMICENCDYLIHAHAKINMIVNDRTPNRPQKLIRKEVKDTCINRVLYCAGYSAKTALEEALADMVKDIKTLKEYNRDLKLLPIKILAIQSEECKSPIHAEMISLDSKYLEIASFTISYTNQTLQPDSGDMEQLKEFLHEQLFIKLSDEIMREISMVSGCGELPAQGFLKLG